MTSAAPSRSIAAMLDVRAALGTHDILLITLDTLRFDVAVRAMSEGHTPNLASWLAPGGWEERHTPGSFTYAAHAAFFAGFFPTPARPGRHERPFALRFEGSETTGPRTAVLDAPDLPAGLAAHGYHGICIGGVGFFNLKNPLGSVLPSLFAERHWRPDLGVTDPRSTEHQAALALERIGLCRPGQRIFLFLNVSAIHQPNRFYVPGAEADSMQTHAAALAYVDRHLPAVVSAMRRRAPLLLFVFSDHGTAYGEDGHHGHRLAHPTVWTVPYGEAQLPQMP
jgi:hypothetical protein